MMQNNILSIDCDWIEHPTQMLELNDFIFSTFKKVERIIFAKNHHSIIKYITNPSNICNVDHHHDLNYNFENEYINAGNWVDYLREANLLEKYTWIHNIKSEYNLDDTIYQSIALKGFDMDLNLSHIKDIQFKDIFICESYGFDTLTDDQKMFFLPYYTFKQVALQFFEEKVIIDNPNNVAAFFNK